MFPYLDVPGFKLRSEFTLPEDIDLLESRYPGFIPRQIGDISAYINARLRKRYGNTGQQNSLPFGQQAPTLLASGALVPPPVSLTGRPTLGSMLMRLQITSPGVNGGTFQWSSDGGVTNVTGVVFATPASLILGATGLTALFPSGSYAADNLYAAAEPVPAIILRWLVTGVAYAVWNRRGRNPQDAFIEDLKARFVAVFGADGKGGELREAADSKDGLFDLPVSEDLDSAITTGGPLGFSDSSPYSWQDRQARLGRSEDANPPYPAGETIP